MLWRSEPSANLSSRHYSPKKCFRKKLDCVEPRPSGVGADFVGRILIDFKQRAMPALPVLVRVYLEQLVDFIPQFPNLIIIWIHIQRATGLIISFCPRSSGITIRQKAGRCQISFQFDFPSLLLIR
jgi:hypothetical protein